MISTLIKKTSYAALAALFITVLLAVNFFLMDRSAIIRPFFAKEQLGGPATTFIGGVDESAVSNSASVFQNKAKDQTRAIFTDNITLTNQSAPGGKIGQGGKFFTAPATGWNWGILHSVNAVDIANSCGTPVYAAAEGLVSESTSIGWNSGYGSYIKIEHANGTKTVYAHLSRNSVFAGAYVFQGDLVGLMGNTGNTHGPTGCHLHFEVRGMSNPFAK